MEFRALTLGFLFLIFIVCPVWAFGDFIFDDDFEAYSTGDLGGQGDWTSCENKNSVKVSGEHPFEGTKSLQVQETGGNLCCERVGSEITAGSMSFWVQIFEGGGGDTSFLLVGEHIDTTQNPVSFGQVRFGANGHIFWTNQDAQHQFLCDTERAYVELVISWNATTNKVKYDCLGESSDWVDVSSYSVIDFNYFDVVRTENYLNRALVYIDNMGGSEPVCEIGSCSVCESYQNCYDAGCYWLYIFGVDRNLCYEPVSEGVCGLFGNCQYCLTQENCEGKFNCEWVDYGLGEACYMTEHPYATTTTEWVVAELDDCSELSGVEKWICETKNFIAGLFLPTQEKMNELYFTLTEFRQKFPFSYINVARDFFADIKNDIVDDNEITISIMGNEGSLDFSFWDKTVSVAGAVQSYKNIFYGFTNILLAVVFFVWLIAFLRRFF